MASLRYFLCVIGCICTFFVSGQLKDSAFILPYPSQPSAAPGGPVCGSDALLNQLRKSPEYLKQEAAMNEAISRAVRLYNDDTIVLPVVFHLLADDPNAIPDQQIINGLADLNDAFAKRGAWSGSKGVDTKIRFCFARKDPEGGNTTGINRVNTHWGKFVNPLIEDAKMKATAQWDPARYINIWFIPRIEQEGITEFVCGVWSRSRVAGYATMPPGGGPTDGIVITGFGLLLAHEMGHYLGLYHTFEGSCFNNDCLLNGDRVCDTPPDGSYKPSPSCTNPENSCNTDTLSNYSNGNFTKDVPDPIENIMDYANGVCQNTFTQGQADRMHAAINTQRKGLLEPKCEVLCTDNVYASFNRSIIEPILGDEVTFTNTSIGGTTYQWLIDGAPVSSSQNFTYKFNQTGRFKLTLRAFKNLTCYSSYSQYVIINCGVTARFYTNKHNIASREFIYQDTIRFINNSLGANNFKWLISNNVGMAEQLVSTSKDLAFMFATPAIYTIRLIASNGSCMDTTLPYSVSVADPTADGAIYMTAVHCYEQTKIKVDFFICNNSFDTIPANTPVSFYDANPRLAGAKKIGTTFFTPAPLFGSCCSWLYSHIIDVGSQGLNQIYIVLNDNGTTLPLALPNTGFIEKNYNNNIQEARNFQFRLVPTPPSVSMEPGDTFRLGVFGTPTIVSSYRWSPADRLNCTTCPDPNYIADTNRLITKRVIATSQYSCFDTTYVNINVPPYNDFRISMENAECTNTDSIEVNFTLYNDFKRGVLPKGLTVRFYDGNPFAAGAKLLGPSYTLKDTIAAKQFTFSTRIAGRTNGNIFAVVNDSTGQVPVVLPNNLFEEKIYTNNSTQYNYQRLQVTTTALTGLIEPGDTLSLSANAFPGNINAYTWSPAYNLSCAVCQQPNMIADTTTIKRVIAENTLGCRDTAYLDVNIPPSDDFTITIDETACAANNKMHIGFTINNLFRRGVLPKGLTIRFYDNDPRQAGANELLPAFMLPATLTQRTQTFTTQVTNSSSGKLFAVINDSGTAIPLVLPNSKRLEKDYSNNIVQVNYTPERLLPVPQDTTVFRGAIFRAGILNTLDNPASTRWATAPGYSLSCTQCVNPEIVATQSSKVPVSSTNKYGCTLTGLLNVTVLPPDFTLQIHHTECINNRTTMVEFTVCMNNNYDTVWKDIPVTFYEGTPGQSGAKILQAVFVTTSTQPGNCAVYRHNILTPSTNNLFAVVNDKGLASTPGSDAAFDETDFGNNAAVAINFIRFRMSILPIDTTIDRSSSLQIFTTAEGGNLQSVRWQAAPFISCTNCLNPVITPSYTYSYFATGTNENNCTDTAWTTIRTITIGDIHIPSAFTPDNDNLNDIFYIMGSERVKILKNFRVFTRWGDVVYEAYDIPPNDPVYGWKGLLKGSKAMSGVYVYQVEAEFIDGEKESYKGTVTLIR